MARIPAFEQLNPINQIKKKAKALNEAADKASEYIQDLSKELKEAGVGLEVWLLDPISTEEWTRNSPMSGGGLLAEPYPVKTSIFLGYSKIGPSWGITVCEETRTVPANDDEEASLEESHDQFLRLADREVRIKAMPHLDDLLEAISGKLSETTEQLESVLADTE